MLIETIISLDASAPDAGITNVGSIAVSRVQDCLKIY